MWGYEDVCQEREEALRYIGKPPVWGSRTRISDW
jgi:hypothetical protein